METAKLKVISPPGAFVTEILDETTGEVTRCHLSTGPPRRVVPGNERHRWNRKPSLGNVDTCKRCGCKRSNRYDYSTVYRLPGEPEILDERPPCTGPAPAPPARADETLPA